MSENNGIPSHSTPPGRASRPRLHSVRITQIRGDVGSDHPTGSRSELSAPQRVDSFDDVGQHGAAEEHQAGGESEKSEAPRRYGSTLSHSSTAFTDNMQIMREAIRDHRGRRFSYESAGDDTIAPPDDSAASNSPSCTEEGRGMRKEERAIKLLVKEFRAAAGWDQAAFEEFETILQYERQEDGRERLIGTKFVPEPFLSTVRRVMRALAVQTAVSFGIAAVSVAVCIGYVYLCVDAKLPPAGWAVVDIANRAIVLGTFAVYFAIIIEGPYPHLVMYRIWRTWFYYLPALAAAVGISVLSCYPELDPWRKYLLGPLWWLTSSLFAPYMSLLQVGELTKLEKRRAYAARMSFVCLMGLSISLLWWFIILPAAFHAQSDRERGWVAFQSLIVMYPFMAMATKAARNLKVGEQGNPTRSMAIVAWPTIIYLAIPRVVQARMDAFGHRLLTSLFLALIDLIGDICIPYSILLYLAVKRAVQHSVCGRPPETETRRDAPAMAEEESSSPNHIVRKRTTLASLMIIVESSKSFSRSASLNLQTALVKRVVSPRYLHSLCMTILIYSFCETVLFLFTNLMVITIRQIVYPSIVSLLEDLSLLVCLIAVESFLEAILYIIFIRWNNLPICRCQSGPGVLRTSVTVLLLNMVAMVISAMSQLLLFFARAVDRQLINGLTPSDICPHFSTPKRPVLTFA
ncbi:unnamed protein product [Vitrella brassicaformis CCMP3155]|uniref:Uncharacterized protein n=1 Tax=Vitrella brassicaformis (strain CCMP3155) TaxID=1169540 RepID=A0A0G4GJH2_VITBC|nr:unnamed protein product [Vitrella brassicaformis CCMP3155]|eukprot:CEM30062.1 unnamed protein product [Vitrella brassicaformis CCMP3155]